MGGNDAGRKADAAFRERAGPEIPGVAPEDDGVPRAGVILRPDRRISRRALQP
ncbi:hypothetical protein [Roseovarius sp. D22-M7]|uniref:hypothetical protein n=1 Tax=Roseovarius sp. D22-M7 TaxID=3127116 RepID=UPI00300FA38F